MMNKVFLVGRLGKDPELRHNSNGTPYVFFSIAINRLPNQNGDRIVDWINCVTWGKQAENFNMYCKAGKLIGIDGTLQTRNVTDNQTNQNRQVMEVYATNITYLDNKDNTNKQYSNMNNNQSNFNPYAQNNNMNMNNNYNQNRQNSYNPNQNNYNMPNNNVNNMNNNQYYNNNTNSNNNPNVNNNNNGNENPFQNDSSYTINDSEFPF